MTSWNEAEELRRDALGKEIDKSTQFNEREKKVRRDFWAKLKALGRHLPFVEDLLAAYYCALDPATTHARTGNAACGTGLFHSAFRLHPRHVAGDRVRG
jgi:hypothetical protein